jgi:hypothetical protein
MLTRGAAGPKLKYPQVTTGQSSKIFPYGRFPSPGRDAQMERGSTSQTSAERR